MKTIEVSEMNYIALEDRIDCDATTHDRVILGMFDFIDALVEQNAKLKTKVKKLEAENYRPWEAP